MTRRRWLTICGFLIFLFVIDRGLAMILRAGFDRTRTGEMGGMVNRVLAADADLVVLGSSRAWRHYDSRVLQDRLGISVFNAGCDGQRLPYISVLGDLLLRESPPDVMIINVDAFTIVYDEESFDRLKRLAPFWNRSPRLRQLLCDLAPFERLKYLSHACRFNSHPLAIVRNLFREDTSISGFIPIDRQMKPPTPDTARPDTQPVAQQQPTELLLPDERMIALLSGTVEQARAHGVKVVLVTSPRWTPDGRIRPENRPVFARVTELAAKWDVPYISINTENSPVFRDTTLYADSAHLNRKGAALFSERLARRLLELDGMDWPGRSASAN